MPSLKEENNIKVLLTGGHAATTAISVIDEIKKRSLDWEIHWVGKKYAHEGRTDTTLEYNYLPKYGVVFHNLESGKIQTKFTSHTIPALLKIPSGLIKAGILLKKIKPKLILSFGGASGSLMSFWGYIFGIPVVIHEQTAVVGRGNKFSSLFARVIAISRDSSRKYFPKNKVVLTGNPITKNITSLKNVRRNSIPKNILITGGSRGSQIINNSIKPILSYLLDSFNVTIQVGLGNSKSFDELDNKNLRVLEQVDPEKWSNIIANSDIVVSRAGANTVSDLIALKKPSILIPIPWSYLNEQTQNARYMASLGLARIIDQNNLNSEILKNEIDNLVANYSNELNKTAGVISPDIKASENLVNLLEKSLQASK